MYRLAFTRSVVLFVCLSALGVSGAFAQQSQNAPFQPQVGQAGKDVVWVPTPDALVQKMLDMAKVTPSDFLMDLGSGDGKTVIAAAQRGVRAVGIEYNPEMVALAQKRAAEAGVASIATFQQADLFQTDLSKATVITMFLLPSINLKLRPTILDLQPGTRIVSNSFTMGDWREDQSERLTEDCASWCTALLWIVPAKVAGRWTIGSEVLTIAQTYQEIAGTLGVTAISDGRLNGAEISFVAGNRTFSGTVRGNAMTGTITGGGGGTFSATRQ
jgi:SAM-dependent methyltransferase